MNVSDRGGIGSQVSTVDEHRERMAARERGEVDDPRLADVRSLTREGIAELNAEHGVERAASMIAAAGLRQLQNVRVVVGADDGTERTTGWRERSDARRIYGDKPSMLDRLRAIDAVPELTDADKAEAKSDLLKRYGRSWDHAHAHISREMAERQLEAGVPLPPPGAPLLTKHQLRARVRRMRARHG